MLIEHDNIFYVKDISEIGGVETYLYEMVKKYHKNDIAVVYKTANINQLKRLRNFCKAYKHTNQEIKCKVAIINYDITIIDYIIEGDIYQTIHADYENPVYKYKMPTHPRVKKYIAITKYIKNSFKKITGQENIIQIYNPLTIEDKKTLVLLSATRLSKIKGKDRMIKLANELNRQKIDYIWYVFTNDKKAIPNDNIIYMEPRLDLSHWFNICDYVVQLSDTEGLSYTVNEALYRNKPVIVTPFPYLEEIGVKNGLNGYIIEFDCSNIEEIAKNINNIPKFTFKKLSSNYDKIIYKGESKYNRNELVQCRALKNYHDIEFNKYIEKGKLLPEKITLERAEELINNKRGKIVEII